MSGSTSSPPGGASPLEPPHSWTEREPGPLGFTVHTMNQPLPLERQRTWRGRLQMLLIAALCAAPVVASYLTYYVIRPHGRLNYGTLIDPPRDMPDQRALPLTDLQGRAVDPHSLQRQWLFVVVAGGACDAACRHALYLQHQIHATLGKDRDRVDRVWMVDDSATVPIELLPALQGTTVLRVPRAALAAWLQPQAGHTLEAQWYVVDPMGRWMLRFPPDPTPAKVKQDFERLLHASASWDQPGR